MHGMNVKREKLIGLMGAALLVSGQALAFWPFDIQENGPFVIAENGEARAAIVVGRKDRPGYRYAANELADYLGRMTGARFTVVTEPVAGLSQIRVGAEYQPSRTDELHIEVKDSRHLEITGDDALGTLYGVYDLLETFGCRFYCFDYEKVPSTNRLELAVGYSRTDAPSIEHRQSLAGVYLAKEPGCSAFALKHRMTTGVSNWSDFANVRYLGLEQKLCGGYIDKKTFFDEKKHPETYHPEWYALRKDGTRCEHSLCASCDEMYSQLYVEVEKDIQEKGYREISLGDDDGWEMCHCPGCEKITASDDLHGNGAQRVVLLNRVAKHFGKKYPEVRFNILVYGHQCPEPAERFRLEPNAGLSFALLWRNHCRPIYCCDRVGTDVTDWMRLSDRPLENWDYGCSFFCNAMPFPNHDTYGANFRYYKKLGISGVFSQMQYSTNGDLAELHHYLYSRLCWDPDADDGLLADEFISDVYGRAARDVKEYMKICIHARDRQRWWWGGCYQSATDSWLTPEDCVRIHQLERRMKACLRHAETPQRVHADRLRISMLYLAASRYDDMLSVADRMKVKLPPKQELIDEWKTLFHDGRNRLPWYGELGETFLERGCLMHMRHIPETPYQEPGAKPTSFVVSAEEMTGGDRRELKKESDGTPFMRLDPKPRGTEGRASLFMVPERAECGVTVGPNRTGSWYIFGTVRTDVPSSGTDEASAYLGLYLNKKYVLDGRTESFTDEAATMFLPGSSERREWRTFCLGRYRLYDESRVWVMCGVVKPVNAVDVREFAFIDPSWFDDEKNCRAFAGAGQMRASKGGRPCSDIYDGFRYWRLDENALMNAAPSIVCTFGKDQAQEEAVVFARVRLGASVPKDMKAARLILSAPPTKVAKEPPVEMASEYVSGSPFDDGWQIVSLGCHRIEAGMTLSLQPGDGAPLRFLDLRDAHLVPCSMLTKKGK